MTYKSAINLTKRGSGIAVLTLCASLAYSQDDGGLEGNFTLSQGITYSDLDGTFARTDLGFDFSSITRAQSLAFGVSTGLETGFDSGSNVNITDPRTTLSYGIQSRQTALTTQVSYVKSDADDVFNDPNGALGSLVFDNGTREVMSVDTALDFGREAKFGGALTYGFDEINYTGTTTSDLIDSTTTSVGLSLQFENNSQITTTLAYSRRYTDRNGGRNVLDENLNAGAQLAMTPTLDANLSLGFRNITETDAGVTSITDGGSYGIEIVQARPNGALQYSLNSNISEAGRRTTAKIGTDFETRRGTFSTSIGVSDGSDNTLRPLLALNYSEETPRGSYSVSLDQSFSVESDGDETLNSRLRLAWQQELRATSRLSSDLTYRASDRLNTDANTARLQLGLQFSQDLTQDWAVTSRYNHIIVDDDGAAIQRENEIFIGIETSYGWRP